MAILNNVFICKMFSFVFQILFQITVVFICISNTISNLLFIYVNCTLAETVALYFKVTVHIHELHPCRNRCLIFQSNCSNT